VDKAIRLTETTGLFSPSRRAAELTQVKLWVAQGELPEFRRRAAPKGPRFRLLFVIQPGLC